MPASDARLGTVATFDVDHGSGTIKDDNGDTFFFHCTSIADGSRVISLRIRVMFEVRAGGPGRWEAFDVRPTPPQA